jgi:hypothetical protein
MYLYISPRGGLLAGVNSYLSPNRPLTAEERKKRGWRILFAACSLCGYFIFGVWRLTTEGSRTR